MYALGGTQKFELQLGETSVEAVFLKIEELKHKCGLIWDSCLRTIVGTAARRMHGFDSYNLERNISTSTASLIYTHLPQSLHPCSNELDVIDWGVSNATLEEVFIRLCGTATPPAST